MCDMRLDLAAISQHWQIDATDYFSHALEKLHTAEQHGLITRLGDTLSATPMGCLLIRQLAMAFDAYWPEESNQRYSKMV